MTLGEASVRIGAGVARHSRDMTSERARSKQAVRERQNAFATTPARDPAHLCYGMTAYGCFGVLYSASLWNGSQTVS